MSAVDLRCYRGSWSIVKDKRPYGSPADETQLPLNPDLSSDKCIGMGVAPATVLDGLRVTASSAYLERQRENLQILTESPVQRFVFECTKAKGVELVGGHFRA